MTILLASASKIRLELFRNAGVELTPVPANIDEESLRLSFQAESVPPRDQADHLAELKAQKIAARHPEAVVIGCDQILEFKGKVFAKPTDLDALREQLRMLRGQTHRLYSAAVIFQNARPVWRHVSEVRLTMRMVSDNYLEAYLDRNKTELLSSVGGYQIEAEGVRLFERLEGDYFAVLGVPLIPLLTWLGQRGLIPA